MINEIKGDLLEAKGVIVHGCNAQGVMGSGVALQVKSKWPRVFDEYRSQCRVPSSLRASGEEWRYWPGLSIIGVSPDQAVVNMVTQKFYGREPGRLYTNYEWVERGFGMLAESKIFDHMPRVVNFPLIGCGLGGGDWGVVSEIIEHRLPDDRFIKNLYVL